MTYTVKEIFTLYKERAFSVDGPQYFAVLQVVISGVDMSIIVTQQFVNFVILIS